LLLASTSVHRRALLARLGIAFECHAPEVDESAQAGEAPVQRALRLAMEKARRVHRLRPEALVIGSDQVASLGLAASWKILHKPGNRERCIAQLGELSGHSADFHTAVTLCHPDGLMRSHVDHTRVRILQLTQAQIAAYVEREPSFDCAGGFKCEGLGVSLFESVATDDPTALVGLPLIGLCRLLREAGVRI
jgi:septum formation protein